LFLTIISNHYLQQTTYPYLGRPRPAAVHYTALVWCVLIVGLYTNSLELPRKEVTTLAASACPVSKSGTLSFVT
jgi:hypothetical protein